MPQLTADLCKFNFADLTVLTSNIVVEFIESRISKESPSGCRNTIHQVYIRFELFAYQMGNPVLACNLTFRQCAYLNWSEQHNADMDSSKKIVDNGYIFSLQIPTIMFLFLSFHFLII